MNAEGLVHRQVCSHLLILFLALLCAGCGGGYQASSQPYTPPDTPPEVSTVESMQGTWEIVFHSDVSPSSYTVLEANLTQTDSHVFAGAPAALVFQSPSNVVQLSRFGSNCDSNTVGDVTFDAAVSDPGATTETLTLSLTENGALGSSVTTASLPTNGVNVQGSYSTPAACGLPADHGSLIGYRDTVRFEGESYSGSLNGGTDSIVVSFASGSGFNLTASGTDNGAPLLLTGSTTGFSIDLTGTAAGQNVHWFLLYDPTYNVFQVYDSNGQLLGSLK